MTQHPELARTRIGDAEREAVVDRLRHASTAGHLTLDEFEERVGVAFGARDGLELDRLVADLPDLPDPAEPSSASSADGRPAADRTGSPPVRWTVGVIGRHRRQGPWRPAPTTRAVAVVGSCRLDVTEAPLGPTTEIRAVAVMGGVEIVVPHGVHVEISGFSILGSSTDRVRRTGTPPDDAPRLHVRAHTVCGGVVVRTPRPKAP